MWRRGAIAIWPSHGPEGSPRVSAQGQSCVGLPFPVGPEGSGEAGTAVVI